MQVLSPQQAAALVAPGNTVAICGVVSLMAPEAVMRALGERFRETAQPAGLTVICPCRTGWSGSGTTGLEHLAHKGMVSRLIAASYNARDTPELVRMALDNEIETYSLPMGVLFRWLRECTAQSPGLLTEVGIDTCFDPAAQDAGEVRVNPAARPLDLVKRVQVDGIDCLFIRSMKIDVAIVRGSVADARGNISLEDEPISAGVRQMAMAARAAGGKVIVVVKRIVESGSLHPRMVEIPGAFVDAVVVDPDAIQTQVGYEPAFTGATRTASFPVPALPLNHQKLILRRAAMELHKGDIVNLGVGMGTHLPGLALEEGFLDDLHFSVEHGAFGGMPAMGVPGNTGAFGAHYNPDAILDSTDLLDFYHGGGLNVTVLGFAQVDVRGNVNVARFNGSLRGPGGFIDITHRTAKVLLCGSLTSGGLKVECAQEEGGPRLVVVQEGRNRKFLKQVEQINLNGPRALARGQKVLVITERCVFEVRDGGLVLTEIAPGIDIDRDIRPFVDFELKVADELATLPAELYRTEPMRLKLPARAGLI